MKSKKKVSKSRKYPRRRYSWIVAVLFISGLAGMYTIRTNSINLPDNIKVLPQKVLKATLLRHTSQTHTTVSGEQVVLKTTILGKTFLISDTTQKKLTGLQTIGQKEYYFSPQTGEMVYGLQKIHDDYYYFDKNGVNNTAIAYEKIAPSIQSDNKIIEEVISGGMTLVGKSPYVYGGGRTDSSIAKNEFDCSSFIAWFYRKAGLPLVVQSAASTTSLAQTGTEVAWPNMQRGDVLVTPNTYTEDRLHAVIYLGNGFILHDSSPTNGVAISRLNELVNYKTSKTLTWGDLLKPGTVRRETGV